MGRCAALGMVMFMGGLAAGVGAALSEWGLFAMGAVLTVIATFYYRTYGDAK